MSGKDPLLGDRTTAFIHDRCLPLPHVKTVASDGVFQHMGLKRRREGGGRREGGRRREEGGEKGRVKQQRGWALKTYCVVIGPLLIPSKTMAVEDLNPSARSLGGDIETEVLLKLELPQISEAKLLRRGRRMGQGNDG